MGKKKRVGGDTPEALSTEQDLTVDDIMKLTSKADEAYSAVSDKLFDKATKLIMTDGVLPRKALAIELSTIEEMYSKAYNLYHRGLYMEAINNFKLLWVMDYSEPKYLMGISACLHMMKAYESAAKSYFLTASRDSTDPTPYYHASDCFLQMNQPTAALKVLEMAIDTAGDEPKYALLKERAQLMLESLEDLSRKELAQMEQEFNEENARKKAEKTAKRKHPL